MGCVEFGWTFGSAVRSPPRQHNQRGLPRPCQLGVLRFCFEGIPSTAREKTFGGYGQIANIGEEKWRSSIDVLVRE